MNQKTMIWNMALDLNIISQSIDSDMRASGFKPNPARTNHNLLFLNGSKLSINIGTTKVE